MLQICLLNHLLGAAVAREVASLVIQWVNFQLLLSKYSWLRTPKVLAPDGLTSIFLYNNLLPLM